jgi:hypothetical protein
MYIHATNQAVPRRHKRIVEDAINRRLRSPLVPDQVGPPDGTGGVLPYVGPSADSPVPFHLFHRVSRDKPKVDAGIKPGYVVVAVFEYSCGCSPSAQVDWFKRETPGGDPMSGLPFNQDPRGDVAGDPNNPSYRMWIDEISECQGTDPTKKGQRCMIAIADTPTGPFRFHQFVATGTVVWTGGKKVQRCSDGKMATLMSNNGFMPRWNPERGRGEMQNAGVEGPSILPVVDVAQFMANSNLTQHPSANPCH